jgi:hypothetical protein
MSRGIETPQERIDAFFHAYEDAVSKGYVPVGRPIGTGRVSAMTEAARALGVSRNQASNYLARLKTDGRIGQQRPVPYNPDEVPQSVLTASMTIRDGVALVFGDAHWTTIDQPRSLAHEAMLAALPGIAPDVLLSVGDLLDLGEPSRHSPLMWQRRHRVREELDAARAHLSDIVALAPKAKRWWVRGNHDDRFDKWLAENAAAFEGVEGLALTDHFPDWDFCWRLNINEDVVAMHRYHGGIHAGWNNTVKAGVTTITGDTHSLEVKPMVDFRGRRWGIQTGMLGDPAWPCFHYMMANSRLWTPGFVVLTWHGGELMPPELCEVVNGVAWFRGKPVAGKPRVRVKAGKA